MTVDYLSCGTCFVTFRLSDISMFIEHKKASCLNESNCTSTTLNNKHKSQLTHQSTAISLSTNSPPLNDITNKNMNGSNKDHNINSNNDHKHESENVFTGILKCVQCLRQFNTPWPFLMHVQIEHQLIFVNSCETTPLSDDEEDKMVEEERQQRQEEEEEEKEQQSMKSPCSDFEESSDDDDIEVLQHTSEDELLKEGDTCNSDPMTTITAAATTTTTGIHEMNNANGSTPTTTTTTVTHTAASSSYNSDNNNSDSTSNSITTTTSTVDTNNNFMNTNTTSTQTHLIGIKQRIIPHRKRKYFNCCINEPPSVTCRKLTNLTCTNLKEVQHLPTSCCTNLSTDLCPYNNPIINNNNSINSNVFVSDYCCTRSIVCKPTTTCTSGLLNTEEVIGSGVESASNCNGGTAVVSCCMRKVVCCNNTTPKSLPVYCSQMNKDVNSANHDDDNNIHNNTDNTAVTTKTTTTINKMLTCCPCSPKKLITSQSCEVQTDFDPEFSYSDYADLAMLLAATPTPTPPTPPQSQQPPLPTATTTTTVASISPSRLSPFQSISSTSSSTSSSSSSSSSEMHQKGELYENLQTDSVIDILRRFSNTSKQDDKCLPVQNPTTTATTTVPMNLDGNNNSNNDNSNHSVTLTGLSSNLDLDLPMESISVSAASASSSSSNHYQQVATSVENLTVQWPKIIQTNVTYPNNNNNANSNSNNIDTVVSRYYSEPPPPIPRRYICRECGTSFRQNVHLRKHIMVQHTKEKPYRCTYCDYTTVEKSHLTVHIRIHTGERPYSCRECGYSSAQNCTLKSHYLRKHPNNFIECHYCSELFFTELELSKHHRICRLSQR